MFKFLCFVGRVLVCPVCTILRVKTETSGLEGSLFYFGFTSYKSDVGNLLPN